MHVGHDPKICSQLTKRVRSVKGSNQARFVFFSLINNPAERMLYLAHMSAITFDPLHVIYDPGCSVSMGGTGSEFIVRMSIWLVRYDKL